MAEEFLCRILGTLCRSASPWAMQGLREAWDADVDSEIENLKNKLSAVQAMLEDAEEQQFESRAIKDWLQKLKQVAYDADDVVDEVDTEAQQSQSTESGRGYGKKWKQVWDYFLSFLGSSSSQWDFINRIRKIDARLDEIATGKRDLHLESRQGSKQLEIIRGERRLVSSVRDESSQFLGRTEDKEQIMKWLMSDDDSSNTKFSVIGIMGMGGMGKTTLAQVVYNEKIVTEKFEVKAWVCVSEHFDVERVTKEIIADVSDSSDLSGKSWNALQCLLRDMVKGKKYLVVLDDVWSEDSSEWERLQPPFTFGARGSRIMVTTRSRAVLNVMQATWTRDLKGLCRNDCRSLFVSRAFQDEEESKAYPKLLEIGEKLVKKSGGLPLAAKAMGGLLACTRQQGDWENILKSRIWNLRGSAGNIIPALRLSYQHLPAHLNRCFTFCSVFPKDHIFVQEELVKIWIAHGFIPREEGKEIEETGSEYFNDLLLRSFFQPYFLSYKMHDLVHDLAQFIAGHECFEEEEGKSHDDPSKIRHLSCTLPGTVVGEDCLANLEPFYESRGLRTLLVLSSTAASKLPQESFERLRFIRVLDLSRTGIGELPNSIGNLKLLRYLNLSYTYIKELPESICSIYSMKTLLLRGCSNLIELPSELRKLIRLRHLDLQDCHRIISMPPETGRLVCLQELPLFVVGREKRSSIAELKELEKIHGRLSIKQLENVADPEDARQANLKNKRFIGDLVLVWSENHTHNSQDEGVEEEIANELQPHPNLKSLVFSRYRGCHFPNWMMKVDVLRLFSNLHTLKLYNCRRCNILPPLGCLPLLSVLVISGMDEVKHMGHEVCVVAGGHAFPSLKRLEIANMVNLEQWHQSEEGDFPCLEELIIQDCPQLRQMPNTTLPNLEILNIQNVQNLEQVEGDFPCLKKLNIQSWKMTSIPLSNLKKLDIQNMYNLEQVKGSFPSLQVLYIYNWPQLRQLTSSTPLPSLKHLDIQKVHNLEQVEGDFPCLEELHIYDCPQLRQITSSTPLPNLKVLDIQNMDNLEQVKGDFLSLEKLIIYGCPQLRQMSCSTPLLNLKKLDIQNVHNLEQVEGEFPCLEVLEIFNCPQVRQMTGIPLPNLKILDIQDMHNLEQVKSEFSRLEELIIYNCPQLRQMTSSTPLLRLKKLDIRNVHNLEQVEGDFLCLEKLIIRDCPQLSKMTGTPLPNLKKLCIQNIHNLEQVEVKFPCLEKLIIYDCSQLRQITSSTPLLNLKKLNIQNVDNLEQVKGDFPYLEELIILNCPLLRPMISSPLPKLKKLSIQNIHNLEQVEGDFPCLEGLWIYNFPQLRQMPSTSLPNLTQLHICMCEGLEALPLLPSLNKLCLIGDTSEGVLKSIACLTSLSSLSISHLPNRISLPWGMLQPLNQLKHLNICWWPQLVKLLEEEKGELQDEHHHLPSTLTDLSFSGCPNLQSLPRGLHALTCLQTLIIEDCPRVTSLPEGGLPIRLGTLRIRKCAAELEMCVKEVVKDTDCPRVEIE